MVNALTCTFGKALLQTAHQVEEVFERQIGMQAADNVELGDCLVIAGRRSGPGFLERHRVCAGIVLLAAEGAQPARRDAHVGRIDVPVHIEVRDVAVQRFAHPVGQPAHRENILAAIERQPIFKAQALPGEDFLRNGAKLRVMRTEFAARLGSKSDTFTSSILRRRIRHGDHCNDDRNHVRDDDHQHGPCLDWAPGTA